MIRRAAAALVLASVAGCAAPASYVAGVEQYRDATAVASAAANMIASRYPVLGNPLALAPVNATQAANLVTPALSSMLEARHYAVVGAGTSLDAHAVSYLVSPFLSGILVRVVLDGEPGAQLLARARSGWLLPTSPALLQTEATP